MLDSIAVHAILGDYVPPRPEDLGEGSASDDDGPVPARADGNNAGCGQETPRRSRSRSQSGARRRQLGREASIVSIASAESGVRAAGGRDRWEHQAQPESTAACSKGAEGPFYEEAPPVLDDDEKMTVLRSLMDWPDLLVQDTNLFKGTHGLVRKARCLAFLSRGQVWHEDFGGRNSWSLCWKMMGHKMRLLGWNIPTTWHLHWRSTDPSPLCTRIIAESSETIRPMHVFKGSVEDSITYPFTFEFRRLVQKAKGSASHRKEAAYNAVGHFVDDNKHAMFGRSTSRADCVLHPYQACPYCWRDPPSCGPQERPLTVAFGSPVCLPWTPFGNREGLRHESMVGFHTWVASMAASGHDKVSMEQSGFFPPELFVKPMTAAGYVVVHAVFGPDEIGMPNFRTRFYGCALNARTLVWVGASDPGDVRAEFLELFSKPLMADGDIFLCDTEDNRRVAAEGVKSQDVPAFDTEELGSPCLTDLFSKGKLDHLMKHQKLMEKRPESQAGRAYIADISQNPDSRNRSSFLVPTITRSSCFVSLSKGLVLTGAEIDASLGFPGLKVGGPSDEYEQYVAYAPSDISANERRSLAGNGMHLACAGAWELFVASSVIRKDALYSFQPLDLVTQGRK